MTRANGASSLQVPATVVIGEVVRSGDALPGADCALPELAIVDEHALPLSY